MTSSLAMYLAHVTNIVPLFPRNRVFDITYLHTYAWNGTRLFDSKVCSHTLVLRAFVIVYIFLIFLLQTKNNVKKLFCFNTSKNRTRLVNSSYLKTSSLY